MLDEEDGDASYNVGWGLIVMILGNIGVNVIVMVVVTGKMLWVKCKNRRRCKKVQIDKKEDQSEIRPQKIKESEPKIIIEIKQELPDFSQKRIFPRNNYQNSQEVKLLNFKESKPINDNSSSISSDKNNTPIINEFEKTAANQIVS